MHDRLAHYLEGWGFLEKTLQSEKAIKTKKASKAQIYQSKYSIKILAGGAK